MGNVPALPVQEAPRQVRQTFERVPTVRESDPRDVVAVELGMQQAMRAEMVYYQQVGLRQYWLSQCYKASGVNHYEDCREDAVELLRYLTYWNGVDFSREYPTEAQIAARR